MRDLAESAAAAVRLEGVPSALAAARDGIDSLLRDRGLRGTPPELTTESLLRGAVASAQLAGSDVSLQGARDGDGIDAAAAGALRLYGEALGLVPVIRRAPLQALARMHSLAAAGESPDDRGRPRAGLGSSARLQAVAKLLTGETNIPAIALAAFAHAELVVIAPFETANGLVARAVERTLLVSSGVDPSSLTVPEAGHAAAPDQYRSALLAYREGGEQGHRVWLLYVSQALTAGAAASPVAS